MSAFFSLVQACVICGTILFLTLLVLLSLPQSKLRAVGLEMTKWTVVAGLALLVVSPLDLLPGLPIDDLAYIAGAIATGRSALGERRKRLLFEEAEIAELQERANHRMQSRAVEPANGKGEQS